MDVGTHDAIHQEPTPGGGGPVPLIGSGGRIYSASASRMGTLALDGIVKRGAFWDFDENYVPGFDLSGGKALQPGGWNKLSGAWSAPGNALQSDAGGPVAPLDCLLARAVVPGGAMIAYRNVQFTMKLEAGSLIYGCILHFSTGVNSNGYFVTGLPGFTRIYRIDAGALIVIAQGPAVPWALGDVIVVTALVDSAGDTTITCVQNGVQRAVVSDGTYPQGVCGIGGIFTVVNKVLSACSGVDRPVS